MGGRPMVAPTVKLSLLFVIGGSGYFLLELLSRHIKTCVTEDIKAGKEETVDELCALMAKLMK